MTFLHSQKTVIVIDHGPETLCSSQQPVEYDIFTKSRAPGFIPLAPITKSVWTCTAEAAVEYARVVYDIYPGSKLLRVITSDTEARSLNSWDLCEQNLQQLMVTLAQLGCPDKHTDKGECSVVHGLTEAVKALCEPTVIQQNLDPQMVEEEAINRGRIVCLTSVNNDNQLKTFEECVQDAIVEHNKLSGASDGRLITLDHCDLVLVHMTPVGVQSVVTHKDKCEISPLLTSEVHVSQSGNFVANKMVELCAKHYNLASTCITGIPMKEEQNASSSANYDVELLHPSAAHYELYKSGHNEGLVVPSKEGLYMDTVTLKWCTPKSNAIELQYSTGAYRLTPVDVNSRPSSCLTNFLLSGRSVMLEQPRKTGTKVISHMLSSHGGEIYIHVLSTTRSILEDPPSISEGAGGRITDYRINDFGELMKDCRLAPGPGNTEIAEASDQKPVERAKGYLERATRFWPITISETIIFNMMSHIDPIPSLVIKDKLTEDELLECKKSIYHIVGMESRNEPLPVPTAGNRGKGPKREEQYRQMWTELEKLVRIHSGTSPEHQQILDCLLECKKPNESSVSPKRSQEKTPERETDLAWKELDSYQKMTEREKQEFNKSDVNKDTSEPHTKKAKIFEPVKKSQAGQSLLSMWTSRLNMIQSHRRNEFAGRIESSGNTAELYIHLKEDCDMADIKDIKGALTSNGRASTPTNKPSILTTNNRNKLKK